MYLNFIAQFVSPGVGKMTDVLCVGHAVFDITMNLDHHPAEDEKCFAHGMISCGGGPAANASVTIARLGGTAAIAAYLGNDFGGDTHFRELQEAGVKTDYIFRGDGPTPVSAILVKPDGSRTVINYKEDTPRLPDDASHIRVDEFKAVLLDGHEPLISRTIVKRARELHIPTVLDAGSLHRGTEELGGKVDYLVAAHKFASQYTGKEIAEEALSEMGDMAPWVVITLGEKGLIWQSGKETGFMKAFQIDAADTTGAGDVFHGCFALGVARKINFQENLRRASAAAALSCTRLGARTGIPTFGDLDAFLK